MLLFLRPLAAAGLFLAVATVAAEAQQQAVPAPGGPMLLVVDAQAIMRESKAGKGLAQQADQQRQSFQKETAKNEADLRSQRDELERQRSVMAADAFAQRARDFQQRVDELSRSTQDKKRTLEYSYAVAIRQVEENMVSVVSDIATERGASAVMLREAVVLFDKNLDITPETLSRLDKKLPAVAFKIVKAPAPGQASTPAAAAPAAAAPAANTANTPNTTKPKSGSSQKDSQKKQ